MGKQNTEDLAEKIFQFNQMPEYCAACKKEFDKKDKEMVESWNVVIKQDIVRLFCPTCTDIAREAIDEYSQTNA